MSYVFYPAKRLGLLIHTAAILIFSTLGVLSLVAASREQVGVSFLLYLLPAFLAVAVVPLLAYRLYALWGASYTLERDGLHLHWGLRSEDIPITEIQSVRQEDEMEYPLPTPLLAWPGAVLGTRRRSGLPEIEYLADRRAGLVAIQTPNRIFVISPADPHEFLLFYRSQAELGSLTPLAPQSVYPAFLLSRFWADLPARLLFISSLVLVLSLFAWASLAVSSRAQVALRLSETGAPVEFIPAIQLLLLPILNAFFLIIDGLLGLFLYRRQETQPLSYLVWGAGILCSLLFAGALVFILRVS